MGGPSIYHLATTPQQSHNHSHSHNPEENSRLIKPNPMRQDLKCSIPSTSARTRTIRRTILRGNAIRPLHRGVTTQRLLRAILPLRGSLECKDRGVKVGLRRAGVVKHAVAGRHGDLNGGIVAGLGANGVGQEG